MLIYGPKEENAINCFAVLLAESFPLPEEEQKEESAFFFALNDPKMRKTVDDYVAGLNVLTHTETMQSTVQTVYKIVEAACLENGHNPYDVMEVWMKTEKENTDDDE